MNMDLSSAESWLVAIKEFVYTQTSMSSVASVQISLD